MKIIYCCYGGAHTSVVAAAIHTGLLPQKEVPDIKKIINTPYYDQAENIDIGKLFYIGKDIYNNDIYIMGMGHRRSFYTKMAYEISNEISKNARKDLLIVNAIALINIKVRIGGFLSKKLKLKRIGVLLTAWGIQKNYINFVKLVNNVVKFTNLLTP